MQLFIKNVVCFRNTISLKKSIHPEGWFRFNLDKKTFILWFFVELVYVKLSPLQVKKYWKSSQYMFTFPASILNNPGAIWCYFVQFKNKSLHKKYPYLELFWSIFSHIRTEFRRMQSTSPCSVRMWVNTDQNNSEYGQTKITPYT